MEPNVTPPAPASVPEPVSSSGEKNTEPSPLPLSGVQRPERYIRTFAGDVDVFQRGGTPGLSPLKYVAPKPAERLIEASPVSEIPQTSPSPVSVPIPEPEPEPLPVPKKPEEVATPLKTYSDDFRQRLNDTHASTATVLAAEQDAGPHEEVAEETPKQNTRNYWYIAAGIFLLIAGGGGVYLAYSRYLTAVTPIVVGPAAVAPIFVDNTEVISGSGNALVQAIVQSVAKSQPPNTVRQLTVVGESSTNVFSLLNLPVPGIVTRNIRETGNMAGVVNTNGAQSPFFILSVDLYSATFSGMLSWEPSMQQDLKSLFPPYLAPAAVASSTAASTTPTQAASTTATIMVKGKFRDETISNHDVRIYRDALGKSVLLYGYWNQQTLVIARDAAAFAEILDRLATSHAQ